MTRDDRHDRLSSIASSSSDRSNVTVVPPGPNRSAASSGATASKKLRATPRALKQPSEVGRTRPSRETAQASPTGNNYSSAPPMSKSSSYDGRRMSDLANYRRDLAVLDQGGGRIPQIQHIPPTGLPNSQHSIAPWVSSAGSASGSAPSTGIGTSFYNEYDSGESIASPAQISPIYRNAKGRQPSAVDGLDMSQFNDDRRPSVASVTTASSQGSKSSVSRGGFKKLQGFFGEEFPGRDGSEISLPQPSQSSQKESRSYSFTRPRRERNHSNATETTRELSPASSRPRTPVPSSDVVPFLYQEAKDIAKYGEAPVREVLTGPDRERYERDQFQAPPKTSSSGRSGLGGMPIPGPNHSAVNMQSGHLHRHDRSNEDLMAIPYGKERGASTVSNLVRSRAQSPTPSFNSQNSRLASVDGQMSPKDHNGKRSLLDRFRRHPKHNNDESHALNLKGLPGSVRSLTRASSRQNLNAPLPSPSEKPLPNPNLDFADVPSAQTRAPPQSRQATFNNKFPFSKKGGKHRLPDDNEDQIGPTDRDDKGRVFTLDTNLNDMEGILAHPPPLTPMDPTIFTAGNAILPEMETVSETVQLQQRADGTWNAPDSWGVRRNAEERDPHVPEHDDVGTPPRPEEKHAPHCIRVFRSDGTFATVQLPLTATVQDVMANVVRKTYVTEGLENYHIVLRKHDLSRVLTAAERPLLIQKRLLQQMGYEEKDRLEDIGREDNGYLCRFLFLSARDSDFTGAHHDLGLQKLTKFNHIDLSGRNLITIPITLYSKASDIISLNLSRNLSLDLPRDFIHACQQLRDIKYANNEARKLPISIGRASRLTYLDVSNNRLEEVDHADLGRLRGLLKLTLANNRLKSLPEEFGAFRSLRTLNLSSNFLDQFPAFLCELEALVDIDVSFNSIASLPDQVGNLKNLEKFVMTNNRLSGTLPSTFSLLMNIRELDIKFNQLTAIDVISELPKLETLSADHNMISQFVGSFERVRTLKLNSNPITKFELVGPVQTLKVLNLSNAQLASIDGSFNNMPNLERLVLDRNYFVSLPNQIGSMKRLEHFSIANNSVGELPPEIGCLTELRVLDVRGNNIRKLPMELWWANKLETLNASSNVLDNFPKPASRPPQMPNEPQQTASSNGLVKSSSDALSHTSSMEELLPDGTRRPSHSSSTLLSVGPSPVPAGPDRKSSVVSVYGKGGRKTSVVSRSTAGSANGTVTAAPTTRKDSGLSGRLTNTFAGSLKNLYLADNQLDDDAFDQIMLLSELRIVNMSYNDLSDMPQRCVKSWPQLVELYLSGNDLTSLPLDDLEEFSLMQVLHINNNKFTNLPADISRAKKLAVLDCGNNSLKYNIANVPYDWNWNLNPNLRYLNLSGNKRLEIKQQSGSLTGPSRDEQYTDFNRLLNLRVLGLMDVTLTQPSIPDQSEDRRVRTSGSLAGHLPYGMADTLGRNEHLSTVDLVVPRFNSSDSETLLGLFDGQALSSGGSKIAKYLHENFGRIFTAELKALKTRQNEGPGDALRRAFLGLNKDLVTLTLEHGGKRPMTSRGSAPSMALSKEDLNSGGVATVAYLQGQDLYVANVGDAQAMLIQSDGSHRILTHKHDPAEPTERQRIRDAGGWVSRQGKLNDQLEVSRAFGFVDLMPAVQAAPYIAKAAIGPHDEMLLIATKELWEYLTPGLVVDVARQERGDLMRASQKLRDLTMAYGSTGKIMVMMISVADLKRRQERSARLHRGQSMSLYPSGIPDEFQYAMPKRGRKPKGEVQDSTLHRLEAEVPAPTEKPSIAFTDIKNSTNLWEMYPSAMRSAIKLHNEVMRRQLRRIGGYEVKTEGDAFMVSFPTATSALLWCFAVQTQLLEVNWPPEILNSVSAQEVYDKDNNLIFKGLSVRMGIHFGEPVAEIDPVTRRMDYFGPMVNKASRISAVADGGQITVSADFISEIQRCLETYQENDRNSPVGSEDTFDDDATAMVIRKELKSLSSQGFEVKDLGEKKLKGLENPEVVYSLYPHVLVGRIDHHNQQNVAAAAEPDKPTQLRPGAELGFDPDIVWVIWKISLRLEMLCSTLEAASGSQLQPPETEWLDRVRSRGGEVSEQSITLFLEHQVSRIETCVSTLSMRHIATGRGQITHLEELRAPMSQVLDGLATQLAELERYKAKFGPLEDYEDDDEEEDMDRDNDT